MPEDSELATYSFRADQEKVEYLDHLIDRKNVSLGPGGDDKISRSDLLRGCIDELIKELEEDLEEGNSKPSQATAQTAD